MTLFTDIGQCPLVPRNRFRPRPGGDGGGNMSFSVNCGPGFPPNFRPGGPDGPPTPDIGDLLRSLNVYNPMQFGAKGDGGTDDLKALQAASNACGAGGLVFLPPNCRFAISDTWHINGPGTTVMGVKGIGPIATTGPITPTGSAIIPLGAPDYNIIQVNALNCAFHDFSIVPQLIATAGAAIYWSGGHSASINGPIIQGLWMANIWNAINLSVASQTYIERLIINTAYGDNIISLSNGSGWLKNSVIARTAVGPPSGSSTFSILNIGTGINNFIVSDNFIVFATTPANQLALNNTSAGTAILIHANSFPGVTATSQIVAGNATLTNNIPALINT